MIPGDLESYLGSVSNEKTFTELTDGNPHKKKTISHAISPIIIPGPIAHDEHVENPYTIEHAIPKPAGITPTTMTWARTLAVAESNLSKRKPSIDLNKAEGKKADVELTGSDTELDED